MHLCNMFDKWKNHIDNYIMWCLTYHSHMVWRVEVIFKHSFIVFKEDNSKEVISKNTLQLHIISHYVCAHWVMKVTSIKKYNFIVFAYCWFVSVPQY